MRDSQSKNSGTTRVAERHRFDEGRLATWMSNHVEGFEGPLSVQQFKGGQSNPTYQLLTPHCNYVLRRKPPGELLKGAHAIDREARVISALEKAQFPVAHVYGLCQDDTVIGTSFYVMEMVEGRIIWDATLPEVASSERRAHYEAMNATLAQLHGIDPQAIGLGDYGRGCNYLERQISRWTRQYLEGVDGGRDPYMDRMIEWLPEHMPAGDEFAIVHGDFRIDNLIFHPEAPRILAVLDWELSTLGHPLVDFAYHLMMYRLPPLLIAGLVGSDLAALGIPSESEYIAGYCQRTRRDAIPHLDFYLAFNMFRLAAIFHGIKSRIVRGTASSTHARDMVTAFPRIAKQAWTQACRCVHANPFDNISAPQITNVADK
jgi:aminoglycoside phosphotransferase (APT) family kinase protein